MRYSRFVLVVLVFLRSGSVFAEQQSPKQTLVIDVYSFSVADNVAAQKGFLFWTEDLKKGPTLQDADRRIFHEEYPLNTNAFNIAREAKNESGKAPPVSMVARVEPGTAPGSYRIMFSQLGRPPTYEGKITLTISPKDRQLVILPTIDLGQGELLETVILIHYKTNQVDLHVTERRMIKDFCAWTGGLGGVRSRA